MKLLFISFLAGVVTFLICNIIESLILGYRGKKNQISNYYKYIRASAVSEENKKLKKTNTEKYETRKIYIIYSMPVCLCLFAIIYISSKSIGLSFIISILGIIYPKIILENRIKRKQELLNTQLRDALNAIVSSLKAGLSINSALINCSGDLEKLYALVKEKPMLDEFIKIKNDLNMGMPIDEALKNFMERIHMEDVDDFVNSVIIVRQKGGNLVEVMTNVRKMINDKIVMKREIDTLIASKKLEATIMTIVPIFIIVSLSIFSWDYMAPLYESFIGKMFIVLGFILLVLNYFVSKKIVDIKL